MKILKLEKHRCIFCQRLEAYLQGNEIEHETVNVEENPEVGAKYKAMAAPILLLLDDAENVVKRVDGFFVDQVEELVEEFKKNA